MRRSLAVAVVLALAACSSEGAPSPDTAGDELDGEDEDEDGDGEPDLPVPLPDLASLPAGEPACCFCDNDTEPDFCTPIPEWDCSIGEDDLGKGEWHEDCYPPPGEPPDPKGWSCPGSCAG